MCSVIILIAAGREALYEPGPGPPGRYPAGTCCSHERLETFGSQVLGTTDTAEDLTVTNIGTASLNISDIAATDDFAVDAVGATCSTPVALAAGANCAVSVTFTPTATAMRT